MLFVPEMRQKTGLALRRVFVVAAMIVFVPIISASVQAQQASYQLVDVAKVSNPDLYGLIAIKFLPDLLKTDPHSLRYFIALNDCSLTQKFNNEFEWPAIQAFYLGHSAEVLQAVVPHVIVNIRVPPLGAYDVTSSTFQWPGVKLPQYVVIPPLEVQAPGNCGYPPLRRAGVIKLNTPVIPPLRVDQDRARKYIESVNGGSRSVLVTLDIDIKAVHVGTGNVTSAGDTGSASGDYVLSMSFGPTSLLYDGRITKIAVYGHASGGELLAAFGEKPSN
jgi:hypothetical protein